MFQEKLAVFILRSLSENKGSILLKKRLSNPIKLKHIKKIKKYDCQKSKEVLHKQIAMLAGCHSSSQGA